MSATALDRAAEALMGLAFLGNNAAAGDLATIPKNKLSPHLRELVAAVSSIIAEHGPPAQSSDGLMQARDRVLEKANGEGRDWRERLGAAMYNAPTLDEARAMLSEAMKAAPAIITLESLNPRKATDLIGENIPDPEPLIEGIVYAETVTVIGALVKMRKTWLALQAALSAVSGGSFLGHAIRRKLRVLFIGGEGSDRTLRKRLLVAIGYIPNLADEDLQNLGIVSTLGRVKLDAPAGEEWLKRVSEGYDVVCVDPYYRFLSVGSENLHEDQRTIQDVFDRLKATGKAIILVHHLRKPTGSDAGAAELRGAGLDGYADSILLLSKKRSGSTERFKLRYILRHDEEPDDLELTPNGPLFKIADPEPPKVSDADLLAAIDAAGGEISGTKLKQTVRDTTDCTKHEVDAAVTAATRGNVIGWRPKGGRGQGRIYFILNRSDGEVFLPEPLPVITSQYESGKK